jgi:hypothetical protein
LASFWIRRLRTHDPSLRSNGWDTKDLLRHLFFRFPVPEFLLQAWASDNHWPDRDLYRGWCVLLGQGASLKKAGRRFGWSIPDGFEHAMFMVPRMITFPDGVRWAEILRLGGTVDDARRLSTSLNWFDPVRPSDPSRLRQEVVDPAGYFLASRSLGREVIAWMVRYRTEMADEDVAMISGWVGHMRYELNRLGLAFHMRGRTPASAARMARQYQAQIERGYGETDEKTTWPVRGLGLEVEVDGIPWEFVELCSQVELNAEGRDLHHCVGSYASRCVQGSRAIVSMRCEGVRVLTLEVAP